MTADVLAHLFHGLIDLSFAVIFFLQSRQQAWSKKLAYIWGGITLSGGLIYLGCLVFQQTHTLNVFTSILPAEERQHMLIAYIMIIIGGLLVWLVRHPRLSLLLRALGFIAVGLILFFHDQPNSFHHAASWLKPYHRAIATFAFITAICCVVSVITRGYKILFVAAISVGLGGLLLLGYRNPNPTPVGSYKCSTIRDTVVVKIDGNSFMPNHISAKQCDKLQLEATDSHIHEVVFWSNGQHENYPNYNEDPLYRNHPTNNMVLSKPGQFSLHDHLNDKATLILTVKAN